MELLKNGTLFERMSMVYKTHLVLPWMQQLSGAVAYLETFNIAHADINLRNILVDNEDQLKLVDFDHALECGNDLEVGYEPYVRSYNLGELGGSFRIAGPATE